MNELRDVLIRPLITEKTSLLAASDNVYVFVVGDGANKIQIKNAVEQVFGVRVADVRTLRVRGKEKRFGRHMSKRGNWKKAYVRLVDGHRLNFFED